MLTRASFTGMPFLGEVQRDDNALLSAALIPKLDRSGLAFLDLDQNEHGELSKIDSKVDLSFSMVEALQVETFLYRMLRMYVCDCYGCVVACQFVA